MRIWTLVAAVALLAAPAWAQDPTVLADIDEALRLAGVRTILESMPSHVHEMTAVAVSQYPKDQRRQFEPAINDVSLRFLAPEAFYRQLRTYFAKHYDAAHMGAFLVLERTSVYRTMHRLREAADTPTAMASRRRFEANLKSDPPPVNRVDALQRLDDAMHTSDLQVRMVIGIMNTMAASLGAQMPPDLEAQSTAFTAKIRPLLANNVLLANLYTYRNADDTDLEDYVSAEQQKDVAWFNRTLEAAILAVAADRTAQAGEAIKVKMSQPFN